jgi:uncharacterized protein (DUF58 family)
MLVVLVAFAVDAAAVHRAPVVRRDAPAVASRGVASPLRIEAVERGALEGVLVRQPLPPDLALLPAQERGGLDALLVPRRRGRHALPAPVLRSTGPLRLARWDHDVLGEAEVRVYPDLPTARRLAHAVRTGRQRDAGSRVRGPLGLGTDFESVREYQPDDDIRRVNWVATARLQRPMSNQYRLDTERDVLCLVDVGRLMVAPIGAATRLDVALDAAVAVAAVADTVGDRCGVLTFDERVRREVVPTHRGGRKVIEAVYDLEPVAVDTDYDAAFALAARRKRALVMVFTDLVDEAAARTLTAAMATLTRRHAVVVVTAVDPDLAAMVSEEPTDVHDVYLATAARELLTARDLAAARLRRTGAVVVEAPAQSLAATCVAAYLRQKARARL